MKRNNFANYYNLQKDNDDNKECILKFSSCDDKYPLYLLKKEELKAFVTFAKKVESMTWSNIKIHSGLKYEQLSNLEKPDNLGKDITLSSMRVTQKFRIIGYRQSNYFYIVWFDRNHNAYKG